MAMISEDRLAEIMKELSRIEAASGNKEAALDFLRPLHSLDFRIAYEFSFRALRDNRPFEALHVLSRHFPAMSTNSWYAAMLATALAVSKKILADMDESISAALPIEWQETAGLHRLPAIDLHIETSMLAGAKPDQRLVDDYARQCPEAAVPARVASLVPATFVPPKYDPEQSHQLHFTGSPAFFEDPTSTYEPDTIHPTVLDCTPVKYTDIADAKLYIIPEMFGLLEVAPAQFSGQSQVGAAFTGEGRLIMQYGQSLWKDNSHAINILPVIDIEEPVLVPFRFAGSYYFHFMTETIQTIYALRDSPRDVVIVLPASDVFYDRIPRRVYEDAIHYAAPPHQKIRWLDEGVYRLHNAQVAARYTYNNLTFQNALVENVRADGGTESSENIIYIARRQTMTRAVINEDEITSMLIQRFQVDVVYLEDLSFAQQVMLFKGARMIIGPHGGGLTNMIFCKPGTAVIEFQLPQMGVMYWHLAALGHLRYVAYVPLSTDLGQQSGHFGSFKIDPEKLASVVKAML